MSASADSVRQPANLEGAVLSMGKMRGARNETACILEAGVGIAKVGMLCLQIGIAGCQLVALL